MSRFKSWGMGALICAMAVSATAATRFSFGYEDTGFHLPVPLPLESREVAFEKEPDFGDHSVMRSVIPTGTGESDFIGFAWDRTAGELHVDLNGDLDLTNDAGGRFTPERRRSYVQSFNNIRLVLPRGDAAVPYVVDAQFYTWSRSQMQGSLTVRSGWRGEIELDGNRWALSVVDNLDGVIDRQDQFRLKPLTGDHASATVHAQTMPANPGLHLAGRPYDFDFAIEGDAGNSVLALDVSTSDVSVGTVDLAGSSITRLILEPSRADGYLVVADNPDASIAVPVGSYDGGTVYLAGGEHLVFTAELESLAVVADRATILKAGGPLDNTVVAERRGSSFKLEYALHGVGGEAYRGLNDDRKHPPRFVVHKGPLKLHTGEFEYG